MAWFWIWFVSPVEIWQYKKKDSSGHWTCNGEETVHRKTIAMCLSPVKEQQNYWTKSEGPFIPKPYSYKDNCISNYCKYTLTKERLLEYSSCVIVVISEIWLPLWGNQICRTELGWASSWSLWLIDHFLWWQRPTVVKSLDYSNN